MDAIPFLNLPRDHFGAADHFRACTDPQLVGEEWDPVASYTKFGWTITSPGQKFDTSIMLLTQMVSIDYEEL